MLRLPILRLSRSVLPDIDRRLNIFSRSHTAHIPKRSKLSERNIQYYDHSKHFPGKYLFHLF
jgi:hypothetical protein